MVSWGTGPEALLFLSQLLDIIFSSALITLLFAMTYKFVPDVEVQWRDVWIGAGLTSILFTVGKFLIGLYLGSSGVASAYGAAGSIITILLWVYYSSLIFLLGAEFTERYARVYGSGVEPSAIAKSAADAESPKRQARPGGRP